MTTIITRLYPSGAAAKAAVDDLLSRGHSEDYVHILTRDGSGSVTERLRAARVSPDAAAAYAGLRMGVTKFDASVAGLGGCPFAATDGAAGNICTEDFAFMCEEMGVETGLDIERLIDVAKLAEEIVGRPLPGHLMRGGTLKAARRKVAA